MPQTLAPVGIYLKQTILWGKIPISSLRPLQCELIGSLSHFHPQKTGKKLVSILYASTCFHFGIYGCNKREKCMCGMNLRQVVFCGEAKNLYNKLLSPMNKHLRI